MRISIWIRLKDLGDLNYFISDNFGWDKEMQIDIWYDNPRSKFIDSGDFINVMLSYDQYKKLEDL